ncbi:LamB/YcsF family protein [Celerinatantimonas sp. YJH-8]|uniref:LamB/YcsF family protein n=1 Tax=Celerinatantimonas sp. YJH-8 TaxID=3228714 RepID=UPI0038C327D9
MLSIDLNSDLGESFGAWRMGHDELILPLVSSANIACGFHAGDPKGILSTLKQAVAHQVHVGAHVGYRDLVGFGRRSMDVTYDELYADVLYQIGALQGLASAAGAQIRYVKPHGALYNTIANDPVQAKAVIDALCDSKQRLPLMALAGSPLMGWAEKAGLTVWAEVFADRAYQADGSLVSRHQEGAVIHDPEQVARRMVQWIKEGYIISIDGQKTPIQGQSICIHGDSPDAVAMAQILRHSLANEGISIRPLTA